MEIIERILAIVAPVFGVIAIGYAYAKRRGPSIQTDMAGVNRITMDVLAPLLIFTALAGREFDLVANLPLILAGVAVSIGSGLLAWPIARMLGYDVRTFVPPMMFNNCGNMGVPLMLYAFGQAGFSAAVALFVASNFIYFSVAVKILEHGHKGRRSSMKKFLLSPMMLAMFAGTAFSLLHVNVPAYLFQPLKLTGDAMIPMMLFALGVRMTSVSLKSWPIGVIGAIACPLTGLAVAWLLVELLPFSPAQRGQLLLFSVLPPAAFCFMVAEQYNQEPDKVASIVMLGNLASLLFVPLGLWLSFP